MPRISLLTLFKTVTRNQLDYSNIIYDQVHNSSFHEKLESIQHDACVAMTSAIGSISAEKLNQELGLLYLKSRRWFRIFCHFCKKFNEKSHPRFYDLISKFNRVFNTRRNSNIPTTNVKHSCFKNSFFSSTEWSRHDLKIKNSTTLRKNLQNFIRPCANSIFEIHNSHGFKSLTKLSPDLSHQHEHKFGQRFQDTLNPVCSCGMMLNESMTYLFIHCTEFHIHRQTVFQNIKNTDEQILAQIETQLTKNVSFWPL